MDPFSELEETFFRVGELLSEMPVLLADEPAPATWWQRLLGHRGWTDLIPAAIEVDNYYEAYELGDAEQAMAA